MNFIIDWVLINNIAIGKAPRKIKDIYKLKKYGINSILSLCSENEAPLIADLKEHFEHRRVVLPDHSYKRYPELQELNFALDVLKDLQTFRPTYVHCVASIERSPLVCMGWLIRELGL